MRTSARSASERMSCWPAGFVKSIASENLPRFVLAKYAESCVGLPLPSLIQGGPQWRVSSPAPGFSTFQTVAPKSASSWVAQGPARMRLRSRILMPASGPMHPHYGPDARANDARADPARRRDRAGVRRGVCGAEMPLAVDSFACHRLVSGVVPMGRYLTKLP